MARVWWSTTRPGAGRLTTEYRVSDDGLVAPAAIYDRDAGTTCSLSELDNVADARCLPEQAAYLDAVDAFADAACHQPAFKDATQCPPPVVQLAGSCGTYYRRGDEIAGFTADDGTCRAESSSDGSHDWTLSPLELAPLVRSPDATTNARIRRIYFEGDGVRFADPDNLFDELLDTECVLSVHDDGTVQCVPYGYTYLATEFTDPACTQPIELVWSFGGHDPCAERAPFGYVTKDSAVYRIGAAHQGAVYTMSSGACELLDDARYELGERVPDDMIARGRVVD